jgi:hypothetical protein
MEKVLTQRDISDRWGVSKQVISNWKKRHEDFPKPDQFVSGGTIALYLESDIKNYEEKRGIKHV